MTDQSTIDRYVKEALAYDVPEELDYNELCEKNFPADFFMLEDCKTQRERACRYETVASMNRTMRRYA